MTCLLDAMEITFERRPKRTLVRGKMIEGEGKETKIRGNLQPERNLRQIKETFGSHIEAALKIYSRDRLRTEEGDGDADLIKYQGRDWEVVEVRRYDTVIPHYKSIAVLRKDER